MTGPLAVALGQHVVERGQVAPAPLERVEVQRQGGHQGLAFAGRHFGDVAQVQHHAADQLNVVRDFHPLERHAGGHPALAHIALTGLFDRREGLGQNVVQSLALLQARPKLPRFGLDFVVRE